MENKKDNNGVKTMNNAKRKTWKKHANTVLVVMLILGLVFSGLGGVTLVKAIQDYPQQSTAGSQRLPGNNSLNNKNGSTDSVSKPTDESEQFTNDYDDSPFNPDNLRYSANSIELNDDVKTIYMSSHTNSLKSVEDNVYIIDNIYDDVSDLQKGDKFVIEPCESMPEGFAAKVSDIKIADTQAKITVEEVTLGDIVKTMDVAGIVPVTEDMIVGYGPGVSPVSSSQSSSEKPRVVNLSAANRMDDMQGSSGDVIELAGGNLPLNTLVQKVNIPINENIRITGEVKVSPKLKVDINLKKGWFDFPSGLDYFELSLDNKTVSSLHFEVKYGDDFVDMASVFRLQDGEWKQKYANYTNMTMQKAKDYEQKLFESKFPIPTAPGLLVVATWYLRVSLDGKISIDVEYIQNNTFGIKYEKQAFSPIKTKSCDVKVTGSADAALFIGGGVELGLSYLKIVGAHLDPEAGIEVAAKTELIDFDTRSNPSPATIHDCKLCVDGDINFRFLINAAVDCIGYGKAIDENIFDKTFGLGDFYITFGGECHGSEFGWYECPYQNVEMDENGNINNPDAVAKSGSAITLVCDVSGSMDETIDTGETKLQALKQAGTIIVNSMIDFNKQYPGNYKIGVVQFSSDAETMTKPSTNYLSVDDAIQSMGNGGGTNISSGLELGIEQLVSDSSNNKIIILMTDGQDNESGFERIVELAQTAKKENIRIFTVGFGDDADEAVLSRIADETEGEYRFADTDSIMGIIGSFIYVQTSANSKVLTDEQGTVAEGETTPLKPFTVPDERGDLNGILYWPGSVLDFIIIDPSGRRVDMEYPGAMIDDSSIPVTIVIPDPLPGIWEMQVKGIETSYDKEPYYAITSFKNVQQEYSAKLNIITLSGAYCLPIGVLMVILCIMLLVFVNAKKKYSDISAMEGEDK